MKQLLTVLLGIGMSFSLFAQDWVYDLEEAKSLASKEQKQIILVFSGSDWCAPCIKLEKNIWESPEFQKAATDNWILLKADFPRKKKNRLSKEQTERNELLAERYNPSGYFPLVVILNASGKVLGTTAYKDFTPSAYILHLQSFK